MPREMWKPSFVDNYDVSSRGRVRRSTPGNRTWPGRILKPIKMKIGYTHIKPVVCGEQLQVYVHALVAYAFLGPRPEGHEVNHIDGDKTNNRIENLEYTTHGGNMAHAGRMRLMVRGEAHPGSKMTAKRVRKLRADRAKGLSFAALARIYGLSIATAFNIATGKLWRHVT